MPNKVFSLHKKERLSSQKKIEELFKEGSSFFAYPFKVLYYLTKEPTTHQHCLEVIFSVPKKKIKKAHQRNTIKRRMREAYRLNKHSVLMTHMVSVAFIYTQAQPLDYAVIEKGIKKSLLLLQEKCKSE
jgi:ribonuclease P protein component